ncbi:MAG TPA: polysaccharide deacetylase family protein, partial [Thermomicrobiales bacterium]|nr:polysaccharide deacetylase family protein [Thermomicrobiales bacterium]
MVRAQTILVLLLVLAVLQWGTGSGGTANDPETIATRPEATAPLTSTAEPTRSATVEPTPTSIPAVEPTATIEPTREPTGEPEPTERPVPPDTGQASSLLVTRGESGRMEVAFTFDAGEGAGHTEAILDLLAEYGVVASFGVTGEWVEANPDLTRRIVADGHMLINHTWDHRSFTGVSTGLEPLTNDEFVDEVTGTEDIIAEVTDGYQTAPYFRFPYGDYDQQALDLLGNLDYAYTLGWSCDTQGWNGFTPDEIIELCGVEAEMGGPGAIIL